MSKLECPKCHKTTLRVDSTSSRNDSVWRLRICTNCRLRVETLETFDEVYEPREPNNLAIRMSPKEYEDQEDDRLKVAYENRLLQALPLKDLLAKQWASPTNLVYSQEMVRRLKEKNKDNI